MQDTIIIDESTTFYEITLNRPEKLNALSKQMVFNLHEALSQLKDKPPKALLLKGAGTSFCSGQDLNATVDFSDLQKAEEFLWTMQEITTMIIEFPAPVISAIQGYALGAGFEIALNSDLIYAADDAVLGFPELKVGLSITQGSSYFLPKKVGLLKAKELLFFSENITAQEAKELGLINSIFKQEELFEKVEEKINILNE